MKNYFDFNKYMKEINSEHYEKQYRKLFSEMGLLESLVYRNVIVICKKETFKKLGRKNYPRKATETEYSVLTMDKYLNSITGVLFFHDRVEKEYNRLGYIPYTMTCFNPDNTTKIKRTFDYIDMNKIYNIGGFREKNILDNLDLVSFDYMNGYKVITFSDNQNNTFDFSVKTNKVTG